MAGFQVANVAEALIETQNSFNDFWVFKRAHK